MPSGTLVSGRGESLAGAVWGTLGNDPSKLLWPPWAWPRTRKWIENGFHPINILYFCVLCFQSEACCCLYLLSTYHHWNTWLWYSFPVFNSSLDRPLGYLPQTCPSSCTPQSSPVYMCTCVISETIKGCIRVSVSASVRYTMWNLSVCDKCVICVSTALAGCI